jgi:D-beta-D-heptose 7-phosphate kinase/D-beta-D-heptose 1-phosphate adenosyltransferase
VQTNPYSKNSSNAELLHLLKAAAGRRILVLGDAFIDAYITGDCSRLSPEAPVPILHLDEGRTQHVLGGAANTAANIASLGGKPVLFCLLGAHDEKGEPDRERLAFNALAKGFGIEVKGFSDGRPTGSKTRIMGQRQQLLRLDREDVRPIASELESEILQAVERVLPTVSAVVISDYAKGLITPSLAQALLAAAKKGDKPVVLDPRPQHADRYQGADYLTPNWKESLGLLGWPGETPCTPENTDAVGAALAKKFHANILLTLGPEGLACYGREGSSLFRMPTVAREVFDVSGAGDTVVAAFALGLGSGADAHSAAFFANRAAGVVVGKLGTATVTPEELLRRSWEDSRLVSREELPALSAMLRAQGKCIVSLNGSFDLLHAGHLFILEEAKAQGDVLVVGLNSDASVKRYKAADRPIVPESERARMLLALRCVDYVHVFDEDIPMPFLEAIDPHVHVNGSEYGPDCIEAPTIKALGGKLHIVDKVPGLSTSGLLDRIRQSSP